jgi:hypothetical protein
MKDKQVVHVQMTWTTCEECLTCAVTDRRTTRVQRTRSLTLANVSSDANEKASDVLALLITPVTMTLKVIVSIQTIERSERVTEEPKQCLPQRKDANNSVNNNLWTGKWPDVIRTYVRGPHDRHCVWTSLIQVGSRVRL